jgi:hypothetical protein
VPARTRFLLQVNLVAQATDLIANNWKKGLNKPNIYKAVNNYFVYE